MHQPDRDVEPPPLAAGEARHLAVGQGGEVERVEQLVGAAAGGAPVEPEHRALGAQLVADALVVARAVALADVADRAPHRRGFGDDVVAADLGPGPPSGAIRVVSMRRVVDLPAPLGPSTATSSPGAMSRSSAPHGVHGAVAAGEVLGESPGADRCHADNARSHSGHFLSAMKLLPPCGRRWLMDRTDGTLVGVTAKLPALLLVARRHVDLRRVSSALCR